MRTFGKARIIRSQTIICCDVTLLVHGMFVESLRSAYNVATLRSDINLSLHVPSLRWIQM